MERLLQIVSRSIPGGHGVAEEHEVLEDSLRVDTDHGTYPTEGRVLLLIVPDGPQSLAPHGQELRQERSHFNRTHQPQSADGDGCVLQQGLWGVLQVPIRAHHTWPV